MMLPHLKYYLAKNPEFCSTEPVIVNAPTKEEHDMLCGYESSKVIHDYDSYVENYIKRQTEQVKRSRGCEFVCKKVAISSEADITAAEKLPDFVRWV